MANQSSSCFLCYVEIPGNLSTKFCSNEESSFLLNHILELPHWENKVERVKFQQAKYCTTCAGKIGKVRDVLEELDILEKQVLQQKYEIELQLKESWEKSQSHHRPRTYNGRRFRTETRNAMDTLRDEIVSELRSSSAVSMLTKLKENQVGKKFRSRENIIISQIPSNPNPGFLNTNSGNNENASVTNNRMRTRLESPEDVDPLNSTTTIPISTMDLRGRPGTSTVTSNFVEGGEEIVVQDDIVIKEEPSVFPASYASDYLSTETEFSQAEYDPLTSDGYHQVNLDNSEATTEAGAPGGFSEHDFYVIEGNHQMFSQSQNLSEPIDDQNQISIPGPSGVMTIAKTNFVIPTIPQQTIVHPRQRQSHNTLGNNRKYICGTCGAAFSRYTMLKTHDKIHIGESTTRRTRASSASTSASASTSSGVTIQRYRQIGTTTKTTSNASTNANVSKKIRAEPVQFEKRGGKPSTASCTCEECGRTFANKQTKRNHVMTIHRRQTRIQCPLCNYGCQLVGNLRIHMTHCHSDERNFKCSLCPATYKQKWQLLCHTRRHTGERPYQCNLCYARFFDSTALRKHQTNNHSTSEPEIVNLEDI